MLSFQFLLPTTGDLLYSYLPVVQRDLCLFLLFQLSVWLNHCSSFCSPCAVLANPSYKITSICNEDFLQPKSVKDHSETQSSPLSHLTVPNQAFIAILSNTGNITTYTFHYGVL